MFCITMIIGDLCQDKSWEDRNEQATEDEEKKTARRRDKMLLTFRMCELNWQVEVRVGHSSGFRLRVFMNLQSGKAAPLGRGQDRQ